MAQLSDDCFAFGGPMMSVDEAVGIIAARVTKVADVETVGLADADGRVLGFAANGNETFIDDGQGSRVTATYTNGLLTKLTDSSGAFVRPMPWRRRLHPDVGLDLEVRAIVEAADLDRDQAWITVGLREDMDAAIATEAAAAAGRLSLEEPGLAFRDGEA